MRFLKIFHDELVTSWRRFVILAALSGLSNAAVLASMNSAASHITDGGSTKQALILFLLAIAIYSFSQRMLIMMSATLAESTVANMRVRFIERLQGANLIDVERLNRGAI